MHPWTFYQYTVITLRHPFELDKNITIQCCATADKIQKSLGCLHHNITWQGRFCSWVMHPGASQGLVKPVIWLTTDPSPSYSLQTLQWQFYTTGFLSHMLWQIPELTFEKLSGRWEQDKTDLQEKCICEVELLFKRNLFKQLQYIMVYCRMYTDWALAG